MKSPRMRAHSTILVERTYYPANSYAGDPAWINILDSNLNSPQRRVIELRMEHADLDAHIDRASLMFPLDELSLRRLKKRRLELRDHIALLEQTLDPKEPA